MRTKKYRKTLQKSIALASITSFMVLPSLISAAFANNNITAGNSGVGSLTNITGGKDSVTNITSGFINKGTGFTHFNQFNVGQGGTANLNFAQGADRYVNMVDNKINIQGTFNALKGDGLGNVMFVSPEGMVVGAGGILNVGSLQTLVPTLSDYQGIISKFGNFDTSDLSELLGKDIDANTALTEADLAKISETYGINMSEIKEAVDNLKPGNSGVISIAGKILATGDVDLQAGSGIYFRDNGVIQTKSVGNTIGDISLFTNTGDIIGSNAVNVDAAGNVTLVAKTGGIGSSMASNPDLYGEPITINSVNVKVGEGSKLNVEVSDAIAESGKYKGYASVTNKSTNLNVGSVKGANVKIKNEGSGTLKTTQQISEVGDLYLNAENGNLNITEDVTAKRIVRLAAENDINAAGNLEVTDNGYISVYAENGSIDMNDAKIKTGNIDIKSNGTPDEVFTENGSVTHGNITISERGPAEGYLRLTDNQKLSTGVKAPDSYRFDGAHITSTNGDIIQKEGTQINSAGRVDLTAGGSVQNNIQAVDVITVHAGKDATLNTTGTARLADVTAKNIDVTGETILVDGAVSGTTVDVTASDSVTIRPHTLLATVGNVEHYTYGKIMATGDINVTAENGISATTHFGSIPPINSTAGNVNLNTNGDIYNQDPANNKLYVGAAGQVDATGNNINIQLTDANGKVGAIVATNDVNLGGNGEVNILDKVSAENDVVITAKGTIKDEIDDAKSSIVAGNDMTLVSETGDVGFENSYGKRTTKVTVGGKLNAAAPEGSVLLGVDGDLVIDKITTGEDVIVKATGNISQVAGTTDPSIVAGGNLDLGSEAGTTGIGTADNYLVVDVEGSTTAISDNGSVYLKSPDDMTLGWVYAKDDVTIDVDGDIKAPWGGVGLRTPNISAGGDMNITADGSIGTYNEKVYTNGTGNLNATAQDGSVNIYSISDMNANNISATEDVNLVSDGGITITSVNAGNNVVLDASGVIGEAEGATEPVVVAGNNLDITARGEGDVGSADNFLTVDLDGKLNVDTRKGSAYIETVDDVVVDEINVKTDLVLESAGNITQAQDETTPVFKVGNDVTLLAKGEEGIGTADNAFVVDATGSLNAEATNGDVYIASNGDINVDEVKAAQNVGLNAAGSIKEAEGAENPSITAGNDMTLTAQTGDVGDVNNYLDIAVDGNLTAEAPQGGVYIATEGNLDINNVAAGKDVELAAGGYIKDAVGAEGPAISSGEDMKLVSNTDDIGAADNYLDVEVGGTLNAEAKDGSIYIGSAGDVVIDQVKAATDVVLEADGNLQQTTDGTRPAVVAGNDIELKSNTEDIGAVDNYLTVDAGGTMKAEATQGSAYIASTGDLYVDQVKAAESIGLKAEGSIKEKEGSEKPSITTAKDLILIAENGNVGEDGNGIDVAVGGKLTAEAENGGVYIDTEAPLTTDKVAAGKDVVINAGDDLTVNNVTAGEDVILDGAKDVVADNVVAGNDVDIVSDGNVTVNGVVAGNDASVNAEGYIQQNPEGTKPAIAAGNDIDLKSNTEDIGAVDNYLTVDAGGTMKAEATEGSAYIASTGDLYVDQVKAAESIGLKAEGSIKEKEGSEKPSITTAKDLILIAENGNVGEDGNGIDVAVGGKLTAEAENGGVYIDTEAPLTTDKVAAGKDVVINAGDDLTANNVTAGEDVILDGAKDVVADNVVAGNDVDIVSDGNVTANGVVAGNDLNVDAEGYIKQNPEGTKPALAAGNDMTLNSATNDIGDANDYLTVDVDGKLNAEAENGGVYIAGQGDLDADKVVAGKDAVVTATGDLNANDITAGEDATVKADGNIDVTKIAADKDVTVEAGGYIKETPNAEQPSITSGEDMKLVSKTNDVGDVNDYLNIEVGGELTAEAPQGGVYIETDGNLDVNKVAAGKDVELAAGGYIKDAVGAEGPAISSGEDMKLVSNTDDIGAADNYLDVEVGGTLNAEAKDGSVYIGSADDVVVDQIKAADDVAVKADGNILQTPEGGTRPAIVAGNDLTLESTAKDIGADDNYLSIDAGGDWTAEAPQGSVYIESTGDIYVEQVKALENIGLKAEGSIKDIEGGQKPSVSVNNDLTLIAGNGNVGEEGNAIDVAVGGKLTAEAENGGVYIDTEAPLTTDKVAAGKDVVINAGDDLTANNVTAGEDVILDGAKDVVADNVTAGNDVDIVSDGNVTANGVVAGNDLNVDAEGYIKQNPEGTKPALAAGNDMTLNSATNDIGDANDYLTVDVDGKLNAEAENGGVYIAGQGDLDADKVVAGKDAVVTATGDLNANDITAGEDATVKADGNVDVTKIAADKDVTVEAGGYIKETPNAEQPSITSGEDMKLVSKTNDVGDVNDYLNIEVGGELTAEAPQGGVYIESDAPLATNKVDAGKDVALDVNGDLVAKDVTAGGNVDLDSTGNVTVDGVKAGNGVDVDAEGFIKQNPEGTKPAIASGNDMNLNSATNDIGDPNDYLTVEVGGELTAEAPNGGVYIYGQGDVVVDKVAAGKDVEIETEGDLLQTENGTRPAITSGEDMKLVSNGEDVGDPNNYLTVDVGGVLEAEAPNGGVYIATDGNLVVDHIKAGDDIGVEADGYIHQTPEGGTRPSFESGDDLHLVSKNDNVGDPDNYLDVKVGGEIDAHAPNGGVYIGSKDDLVIDKIEAGKDVEIITDGDLIQNPDGGERPAITSGEDMKLISNGEDVGDPNDYLTVDVGGVLEAEAPNGGVYIATDGNLVVDHIKAGDDIGVEADGYIHQTPEGGTRPSFESGDDLHLVSKNDNVGDPDNYLDVKVGGEIDAHAPNGGVYIGSKDDLVIDKIEAGKDVEIITDGDLIQNPDGGERPAISSGEDMKLISNGEDVGDPDDYLTVDVGGELEAEAPNGGVYIYGYGDLVIDKVEAGKDVEIETDGDLLQTEDGTRPSISAGEDLKLTSNGEDVGDPNNYLDVQYGGELKPSAPNGGIYINGWGADDNDNGYTNDGRDQRAKISSGDNDDTSGKGNRQHLRYNVTNAEYMLLDSENQAGGKVVDILNISKQGMLVETTEIANIGDTIKMSLDYKGLPFTVEGEVVRVDPANNTAGISFNGIDQMTSSMILYLGMLNSVK